MLDDFKKIFNGELKKFDHEGAFTTNILGSSKVRAFTYEVCKNLLQQYDKPFRVIHLGVGQYHKDTRFEKIKDARKYYIETLDPTSKFEFLSPDGNWYGIA